MKILLISYYSLPLNGVSSYRLDSFCNHFASEGVDVTLLTRHWDENFTSWSDILATNKSAIEINTDKNYRVIRLPYISQNIGEGSKIQNKIRTLRSYLTGNLQPEIDAYTNFKKYALELLQKEGDFDLILVSTPPNNLVKLAYYLNKKTGVPYVVDFRDFFNFTYLIKDSLITRSDKIIHQLSLFHLKKWLKNSALITTVSPKLETVCKTEFDRPTLLVPNGYEAEYFENCNAHYSPNEIFTLSYLGSAYNQQDFSLIIRGLLMFQKTYPTRKFKIQLIGLHNPKIEKLFTSNFGEQILVIHSDRIPKNEIVKKTINSDVLMLPWNNFDHVYGTKVFDYIASGSHILLAPSDGNLVEELIKKTKVGSICNSATDVCNDLDNQYLNWEKGLNKHFNKANIIEFSREMIAKDFLEKLRNF